MRGRKLFVTPTFAIDDTDCGNRVGTDGILLGLFAAARWRGPSTAASVAAGPPPVQLLDIGVGSGIVALTWLQDALGWTPAPGARRNPSAAIQVPFGPTIPAVHVEGWDIDHAALAKFEQNCAEACSANGASHRVKTSAIHVDVSAALQNATAASAPLSLGAEGVADVIVCNPPFFEQAAMLPHQYAAMPRARRWARLRTSLDVGELAAAIRYKLRSVPSLDAAGGAFVIYPASVAEELMAAVGDANLARTLTATAPRLVVREVLHVWDNDADRCIAAPDWPIATGRPLGYRAGLLAAAPRPTRTLLHIVLTCDVPETAPLPRLTALSLHVGARDRHLSATYRPWALRMLHDRAK